VLFRSLDEVLKMKRKIRRWGMDINRVTLPNISKKYMNQNSEEEIELKHSCESVKVFSEAGINLVRQRFEGDTFPEKTENYEAIQIGRAIARGESLGLKKEPFITPSKEELSFWRSEERRVGKEGGSVRGR